MGPGFVALVAAACAWAVSQRWGGFSGTAAFVLVGGAGLLALAWWPRLALDVQRGIMIWGAVLAVSLVGAIPLSRAFLRSATRVPAGSRKILAVVLFPVFMVASVVVIGVGLFALVLIGALVVSMAGGEANVAIMDWLDQRRR